METIPNHRLSVEIPAADMMEIRSLASQIEQKLPFLTGLTKGERVQLAKISRSNKLFVDDTIQAVRENSKLLPGYVSLEELEKDYNLYRSLGELLQIFGQLYEKLRDTQMLAGSEAYSTALMAYQTFQMAAGAGIPGMDSIVSKLSARFEGQGNFGGSGTDEEPDVTAEG